MKDLQTKDLKTKLLKLIGVVLAGSVLLAGCGKTEETSRKSKNEKKSRSSSTSSAAAANGEVPANGAGDPSGAGANGQAATGNTTGTYRIDAKLWSADVPDHFKCIKDDCIDTEEESYFVFYGDPAHPDYDYFIVSIKTEDAEAFRKEYQYYFSLSDYAEGTLPTTNIEGYEFVEYTSPHFGNEIDITETCYVYRHEAASMTVKITFGDWTETGSYAGWAFFDHFALYLPDLGLSDPPFSFESGEHQTTVTSMPLGTYTVTPNQAHFGEHVFVTSEGGIVRVSSTATHAAASEKYLYTCDIRTSIVYIYRITDEEMTKVTEVAAGIENVTVDLLDGDTVTFYADPYDNYLDRFFIVETTDAGERVMSCLNDVAVSPDGSVIFVHNPIASELHLLHLDPVTNTVTAEPMELDQVPLECWDLQYAYVTTSSIFIRFSSYEQNNVGCALVEYDHNGKMIRKWQDDTLENMYTYAFYEFGGDFVLMDQNEDTLRLMDRSGHTVASVSLSELIGIDDMEFTHYSLLKRNDQGDFLLLYAYDNGGVLEDLVFHIHIA